MQNEREKNNKPTDEQMSELYESLVSGDINTAGQLYTELMALNVYRFAINQGLPPCDAEEIRDSTFLKTFENFIISPDGSDEKKGLRNPSSIGSFIFKTAYNSIMDLRRADRHVATLIEEPGVLKYGNNPSIESTIIDEERLAYASDLIQQMPADIQEVLLLRYRDGMPIKAIANKMEKSEAKIKYMLQNAFYTLRTDDDDEEDPIPHKQLFEIDPGEFQPLWNNNQLQDNQKKILELRYMNNLPIEEIAQRMNIQENTARGRLSKAKRILTNIVWMEYSLQLGTDHELHSRALRFALQGFSYKRIAKILKISPADAKNLVEVGIKEIRKLFPQGVEDKTD